MIETTHSGSTRDGSQRRTWTAKRRKRVLRAMRRIISHLQLPQWRPCTPQTLNFRKDGHHQRWSSWCFLAKRFLIKSSPLARACPSWKKSHWPPASWAKRLPRFTTNLAKTHCWMRRANFRVVAWGQIIWKVHCSFKSTTRTKEWRHCVICQKYFRKTKQRKTIKTIKGLTKLTRDQPCKSISSSPISFSAKLIPSYLRESLMKTK